MKKLLLTTLAVSSIATTVLANDHSAMSTPVISGEVSLDFAETVNNNWGGTMGLELDVNAHGLATVDLGFTATDGNALVLDSWTVGTDVNGIAVAVGDDNGVFVEAFDEDHATLAAPAITESVKVTVGDASVAVGLNDWTTDITDVSNIQGSYNLGEVSGLLVTAAADYNLNTKNVVLGAVVGGLKVGEADLSGVATYDRDAELFAFEGIANVMGITAYANGNQDDMFQNVGGEYTYALGGAELTAGANYDLNAKELTPTFGIGVKF